MNARRGFDEDEEEENTNFGSDRGDPFARFKSMLKDKDEKTEAIEGEATDSGTPGSSSKSKTIERTSEVSQKVSEKKEKDGRLLAEHEASKLDKSNLFAKQIDTYQVTSLEIILSPYLFVFF